MSKTILITGATDGIGLETARHLAAQGHRLLIHGRSEHKLALTAALLKEIEGVTEVFSFQADLSRLPDVAGLATAIAGQHDRLDVLINNAGVFKLTETRSVDGLDIRFVVNTIAPYLLTKLLLPIMSDKGRVVNLSSAAQAPVDLEAFVGKRSLGDSEAYAQSKLALTMWSFHLGQALGSAGPVVVAVNPASFLASKMVRDAYGMAGNDLAIGVDILDRAALSDEFAEASGRYYDNDKKRFAAPQADALNAQLNQKLVAAMASIITEKTGITL